MDSPLETSYLQIYNRANGKLERGIDFPGPVWYSKVLMDGSAICQSTVEIGQGVESNYAQLFFSDNFIEWTSVAKFRKDCLSKKYFKFGVIAFSEGNQNTNQFTMHTEALVGVDGKSMICSIQS